MAAVLRTRRPDPATPGADITDAQFETQDTWLSDTGDGSGDVRMDLKDSAGISQQTPTLIDVNVPLRTSDPDQTRPLSRARK